MQIHLRKGPDGFHLLSGHMRLRAALTLADEVQVNVAGLGEVLIAKLPDGSLVATQDKNCMALLGLTA